MTKEEIIEMAKQAGFMFTEHGSPIGFTYSMLESFAKLVAEKERTWVELTKEECFEIKKDAYKIGYIKFCKLLEDKLKEKNT
jgi:hypothetical protein